MGRYYFGTINGKYWGQFISSDPSNFKDSNNFTNPPRCNEYMGCSCIVKYYNQLYCKDCYSCIEEHLDELKLNDEYLYKLYCKTKSLITETNLYKYYFERSELEYVQTKLNKLESQIGQNIIKQLDIVLFDAHKDNNGMEPSYDYEINEDIIDDLDKKKVSLIFRWCLGKQIEFSIKNLDYCEIFTE